MPHFDMPLDDLRLYRPARDEPDDFDAFWQRTLEQAGTHRLAPLFQPHDAALSTVEVLNVAFSGWGGHRIRGWLLLPAVGEGPHPCVVTYLGYCAGRGAPYEHLVWPAAGWAVLVMDTRGQGGADTRTGGVTPDPYGGTHAEGDGFMTRGVLDPETYYYRRVITDAVRAVDCAAAHPAVDARRIVVVHSVALMDATCPPSTVFAAHNHWKGPKRIKVYPWNDHEGGAARHREVQLRYLRTLAPTVGRAR